MYGSQDGLSPTAHPAAPPSLRTQLGTRSGEGSGEGTASSIFLRRIVELAGGRVEPGLCLSRPVPLQ